MQASEHRETEQSECIVGRHPQRESEPLQYLRRSRAAAAILGMSPSTLAKMRMRGDGPAYIRLSATAVAYADKDLKAWIDARRRRSTSQEAA